MKWFLEIMDKNRIREYAILLSAPLLLTIYYYRGYANRFLDWFPSFEVHPLVDLYRVLFQFASFFVLMFVVPVLFNRMHGRRTMSEMGLGAGDWKLGLKLSGIVIPLIVVPVCYFAAQMPDVRAEYPMEAIGEVLFATNALQ